MGGLLQLGGDWAGPQPAQAPRLCIQNVIAYPLPINGQCTNRRMLYNGPLLCGFNVPMKRLKYVRT